MEAPWAAGPSSHDNETKVADSWSVQQGGQYKLVAGDSAGAHLRANSGKVANDKPRPEKKRDRKDDELSLLTSPAAAALHVLPMELRVGDRLGDATGELGRPYATSGGKVMHVRVRKPGQTTVEERSGGAHERVEVRRT